MSIDQDQQRDAAEERWNREFCPACGDSPCTWDGEPDGFHTDEEPDLDTLTNRLTDAILHEAAARVGDPRRARDLATEAILATDQIAGTFADIIQPCTCRWATRPGSGWRLADRAENCPSPAHREAADD